MIPSMEATKAVNFHRKDALVVSTSFALREWSQVSERRDLDVDLSDCMDRAHAGDHGYAHTDIGAANKDRETPAMPTNRCGLSAEVVGIRGS